LERAVSAPSELGRGGWIDLTVGDAAALRDFYAAVVGWRSEGVEMGGYQDYCMLPAEGGAVAGVCHARGANDGLPAQRLIYVTVDDLDESLRRCQARGGALVRAVCALFQKA
jgi:hypothetical protein